MDKTDQVIELLKEIRDNQKTQINAIAKPRAFSFRLYAAVVFIVISLNYLFNYFAR
jgi:uncharacterized membrane protein YdbT with pleckstrin-like domain